MKLLGKYLPIHEFSLFVILLSLSLCISEQSWGKVVLIKQFLSDKNGETYCSLKKDYVP